MRILDTENDKALKDINIYLTRVEVHELFDDLKAMLETSSQEHHVHINDLQYEHEITFALYDEEDVSSFDERSKILINHDK
ncbi:hypothetical protein [Anaerovorax odorimutans]|uniref:hypothetical protein n=1 Tax=Anaerovorax odorimutans TaxID=109327 RepID=UPI0004178FB4|nr:hypothetical protein [Anaerovorax odorimutans]